MNRINWAERGNTLSLSGRLLATRTHLLMTNLHHLLWFHSTLYLSCAPNGLSRKSFWFKCCISVRVALLNTMYHSANDFEPCTHLVKVCCRPVLRRMCTVDSIEYLRKYPANIQEEWHQAIQIIHIEKLQFKNVMRIFIYKNNTYKWIGANWNLKWQLGDIFPLADTTHNAKKINTKPM